MNTVNDSNTGTHQPSKNLMDGMFEEMTRCREVLTHYEAIGPAGLFGATMIKRSIALAEQSIKENDVIKMLIAYNDLKEVQ